MSIPAETILNSLPPAWDEDLLPGIRQEVVSSGQKIIVLDDDPTGTQTVYDTPVLTSWTVPEIRQILQEPAPLVYILTNSRSLPENEAVALNREICANIEKAKNDENSSAGSSKTSSRRTVIISRSDSTLRGHFPAEVDAILEQQDQPVDGILLIPFFEEGRRYTVNNIHYVSEGDAWTPAGETEFARDAVFGYKASDMRAWVTEKTRGRIQPEQVASVGIPTLRQKGPAAAAKILMQLENHQVCIVNAVTYRDLEVFVSGLLQAEKAGKYFLYRTAASFVRIRAGLASRGLLGPKDLANTTANKGGLVIAGSYVQKSTRQIENLLQLEGIAGVEVSVPALLDDHTRNKEIQRTMKFIETNLQDAQDVLVYTSRNLITQNSTLTPLQVGGAVSSALVEIVRGCSTAPAWIVAKGGITSSDIATKGLGIRRANVLGQILPGVPVWKTGSESKWKDSIYVVFPGNVGGDDAISRVVKTLRQREEPA